MKKILQFTILGVAFLVISIGAKAQQDFTLYHMRLVPSRMYQNPALVPEARSFVGYPFVSSIYFNASNSFSYNNIITHDGDSLKLDIDKLLGKLGSSNYLFTNLDIDILSFGFRAADSYYISFAFRERTISRFMYSKDLFNFIWKGNGAVGLGQTLNFDTRYDAMVFDEFSLGLAQDVDEKLTVGMRIKLLDGRFNINTERGSASLYTDPNSFDLQMKSNVLIRTSGIDSLSNQSVSSLVFPGNLGFGIDLGATYKLNSQFTFSASLIDLGYINWKKQLLTLVSQKPGETVNFNGIDINNFISHGTTLGDGFSSVLDTLKDKFKVDSVYGQAYKTYLPVKFYLGADYNINDKNTVGLLFYSQFYNKKMLPSVSLSYYSQVGRVIGLSASYSIMNKSYNNLGLGISLNVGAMQFYAATDNILAFPNYKSATNAHIHAGMVFTFGRKPKDTDKDGVADKDD
ncbi:MAG TPA: DUF5723 family protein, partial [Williamwhitmania sp.]|nr:DUF5723 family protein [Williamwhitmania sp.]